MYLFNEKKCQVQIDMFRSPWRDSVFGGFDQILFFSVLDIMFDDL